MRNDSKDAPPNTNGRAHTIRMALKLFLALALIAAPVLIASHWVPGVSEVAFFGILAASFGWLSGGSRIGAAVVAALAVLGIVSVLLRDHTWVLALMLIALGLAYGFAASRGFGALVLQLPILTPYFMRKPPALLHDPPVIDTAYIIGILVTMIVAGLWTMLILRLAAGPRTPKRLEVSNPRISVMYGLVLGVISAGVMVVGTTIELKTHWVWAILTLYVLADPEQLYTPRKMWSRVLGTLAGFVTVSALSLTGLPDSLLTFFAIPALWLCLVFMIMKKPYWQYTFFLTITVVLMDTSDVNTLLLDAERFGFTIAGAGLSVIAALVVNFIGYGRTRLTAPAQT